MTTDIHDIIIRVKTVVEGNIESVKKVLGATNKEFEQAYKVNEAYSKTVGKQIPLMGRLTMGIRKATGGFRGFRMEMLSVMFGGMALQNVMFGLLQPAFDMVGIFDLLNITLGVVFLPIALALLQILLPIMIWFIQLPEPVKMLIGVLVIFAGIVGTILMAIGTLSLFIGAGLIPVFGSLLVVLGPVILVILAIIGVIAALYLAWQTNFGGIREIFATVWNAIVAVLQTSWAIIKGVFDIASEFILSFFEGVFGQKVTWEDVWKAITTAIQNAWTVVKPVIDWWAGAFKTLAEAIGPVVEMLKPFMAGAGKMLGGALRWAGGGGLAGNLIRGDDVILRPGQSPIALNPDDTITATKGGMGGGNTFNISIDINASGMSVDDLSKNIGDRIESELRMRSR